MTGAEVLLLQLCNAVLPLECKLTGGVTSVSPVILCHLARRPRLRLERQRSVSSSCWTVRMLHAWALQRCTKRGPTRRDPSNQPPPSK